MWQSDSKTHTVCWAAIKQTSQTIDSFLNGSNAQSLSCRKSEIPLAEKVNKLRTARSYAIHLMSLHPNSVNRTLTIVLEYRLKCISLREMQKSPSTFTQALVLKLVWTFLDNTNQTQTENKKTRIPFINPENNLKTTVSNGRKAVCFLLQRLWMLYKLTPVQHQLKWSSYLQTTPLRPVSILRVFWEGDERPTAYRLNS